MKFCGFVLIQCLIGMALASVLGIDFGQEFTKAVLVAPGLPFEVVLTPDSKRKEPSVLGFKRIHGSNDIERLYGSDAVTFASRSPREVALYTKPLLGLPLDDQNPSIQDFIQRFPGLQLVSSKNNRSTMAVDIFGVMYPLEELLAMNFDGIKSRATAMLADNIKSQTDTIKDVAVTVPPHFTSSQRRAIADAVEIAGLKLISVIDDGTAVAVNYASNRQFSDEKEYHVIYDMGAGSTDATLVSFRQSDVADGKFTKNVLFIEIEGIGYEESLSGHQLTQSIVTLLRSKFLQKNPKVVEADFLADERASRKLWREAERVKVILSANTETVSSIESFYNDIDFKVTITRDEFEAAVSHFKPLITAVIRSALSNPLNPENRQNFSINQISSVIFTGGSTRVPFVQREIEAMVGEDMIAKNVNADEAAVMGATLRAVAISGMFKSRDMNITERSIWDYRLTLDDGTNSNVELPLFPRGSKLGSAVTITFPINTTDFGFTLSENNVNIARYDLKNINHTVSALYDEEACPSVNVEATFTLSLDRLVEMGNVVAQCVKPTPGFFDKLLGKKDKKSTDSKSPVEVETGSSVESSVESPVESSVDSSVETSSTESSSSSTEKPKSSSKPVPPRISRRFIQSKVKYIGARPMGSATKQASINHLRELAKADIDRAAREKILNDLEGSLYSLRHLLLDDDERDPGLTNAQIEEAEALYETISDWLEYEARSSVFSLKFVKDKMALIDDAKETLIGHHFELMEENIESEIELPPIPQAEVQQLIQRVALVLTEIQEQLAALETQDDADADEEVRSMALDLQDALEGIIEPVEFDDETSGEDIMYKVLGSTTQVLFQLLDTEKADQKMIREMFANKQVHGMSTALNDISENLKKKNAEKAAASASTNAESDSDSGSKPSKASKNSKPKRSAKKPKRVRDEL